jgi:hypothetical protein
MPKAVPATDLALFQCLLIGTWTNVEELTDPVRKLPLSFNVMPLPQVQHQPHRPGGGNYGGFILKNFSFTETIRFNGSAKPDDPPEHRDPAALAVVASAPNRGGSYTQSSHAIFYDQQVQFAEGPQGPTPPKKKIGDIVHVENGAWLHFDSVRQILGPYDPNNNGPYVKGTPLPQPPYITVAKQISVPHGNSVLALGSVDIYGHDKKGHPLTILPGRPVIADAFIPYPEPADITVNPQFDPYKTVLNTPNDYENPSVEWTWNANKPLQEALDIIKPKCFLHWSVTTRPLFGGSGIVTNIPFEQRKSNVIAYWADYWLLSQDSFDNEVKAFDYLAYSQTILMEMEIFFGDNNKPNEVADPSNYRRYVFPHVTTNTVKRIKGTPSEARRETEGLEGGGK